VITVRLALPRRGGGSNLGRRGSRGLGDTWWTVPVITMRRTSRFRRFSTTGRAGVRLAMPCNSLLTYQNVCITKRKQTG